MIVPTFETERLILREITAADLASYQKYFADYAVISELTRRVPWPYPDDGVETFFRDQIWPNLGKDRWAWGIFLKSSPDELIGSIDLFRDGKPENRGFWLGRPFWGRGIMTEAVCPITEYAFCSLGFDVLIFSNAVGNIRSRRVKEKTGAKLVGVRPAELVNPSYTHAETWELRKEDWETKAC